MALANLADFIIKSLIDETKTVQIAEIEQGNDIVLEVHLPKDEMGKVIGKQGKTIRAIRTIVNAAAQNQGKHASIELLE